MRRPTIKDLAEAAGVSVATANRVIGGAGNVRPGTMKRVEDAAEAIGFYGLGTIRSRVTAGRPRYAFGFLLQQPGRTWYQMIGRELRHAVDRCSNAEIDARIEFLDDLSPQSVAGRMMEMAQDCQAIGIVSAVHPIVSEAVETLKQRGVPVVALVSQLAGTGQVPYVGLDNWKVGRTAAWAVEHICKGPGKLGILVGNHRYRCQEMNETGFRSYFRELAPEFTLLEPLSTFESSAVAQEMTERLLREHPDLAGLYVAGGGITGAVAALRASGRAEKIVSVGYELMEVTRAALLDDILTFCISNPLPRLAEETLDVMISAVSSKRADANYTRILPFELYTRENV